MPMRNSAQLRATPLEIQTWIPERFDEIVANTRLINYLQNAIRAGGAFANTLLIGPSRTGKTASLKIAVKGLMCPYRNVLSCDPCGECNTCQQNPGTFEHRGMFLLNDDDYFTKPVRFHYLPIDCANITAESWREQLMEMKWSVGVRIVYLDEVHRLARRGIDEMFLKAIEERGFVWFASSTTTGELERAFLNRFPMRMQTSLPTPDELAVFLANRCKAWQLDWDDSRTLMLLAERSNQITGKALEVLACAAAHPDRVVTLEMVEEHDFTAGE